MSAEDSTWRTALFRQVIGQKIDEILISNKIVGKRSSDIESSIFQKSRMKEEYLSFVARTIIHIKKLNDTRYPHFLESEVFRKQQETADEIKNKGNIFFSLKLYNEALIFYDQAIKLNPKSVFYFGNRTACLMMMGRYREASKAAAASCTLDPSFVKGHLRVLKCHLALGEIEQAEKALKSALNAGTTEESVAADKDNLNKLKKSVVNANDAVKANNFPSALQSVDVALSVAVGSLDLKLLKAEILVYLGRFDDAKKLANDLNESDIVFSPNYIFGLCYYYQGNIDLASSYLQSIMKNDPNNARVRDILNKVLCYQNLKAEGNVLFAKNQFASAYKVYCKALLIDPKNGATNSKLYFNRGTVNFKLGNISEAVADYSEALKLDNSYYKALSRRGQCYIKLNDFEKAVFDLEKVYRAEPTPENKRFLDEAKSAATKSKRKDYYGILGVPRTATLDEVKKAYRKRALIHHPDRHVNSSDSEKLEEEKKFKEIGEAYAILSDPVKRAEYNRSENQLYKTDNNLSKSINALINRAFNSFSKHMFKRALEDAERALSLDFSSIRAYLCIVNCYIALGNVFGAELTLGKVQKLPGFAANAPLFNLSLQKIDTLKSKIMSAEKFMLASNYTFALKHIESLKQIAPGCEYVKMLKIECFAHLRKLDVAFQLLSQISELQNTSQYSYVRGLCYYFSGKLDQAALMFKVCKLPLEQSSQVAYVKKAEKMAENVNQMLVLKEKGNEAYANENLKLAIDHYSQALLVDRSAWMYNAIIYANRGAVFYRLKSYKECIADCSKALELDNSYQKALLRRAQCYLDLKNYKMAVKDYAQLCEINRNQENLELLNKAKTLWAASGDVDLNCYVKVTDDLSNQPVNKNGSRSKQTTLQDFFSNKKPNLRKRTRKNYKIASDSDDSESEEEGKTNRAKKKNTIFSGASDTDDDDNKSSMKPADKKGESTSSTKTRTSYQKQKPVENNKNSNKSSKSTKGKIAVESSLESDYSPEDSNSSFCKIDSSDSDQIFLRKRPGKKVKITIDSSEEDINEIKNIYQKKTVSRTSKRKVCVQEQKYKKVVGGRKKNC